MKVKTGQQIVLPDGRQLGYAEYGDAAGKPIIFMHGFPGSRLDWLIFDQDNKAAQLQARIIAVDRPGMGLSDRQRNRAILDWPDDVIALMDALQVEQTAVLALSGGGPYGAACAAKMPERLTKTAIVCGMGPAVAPGAMEGASWTLPEKPSFMRRLILFMLAQTLKQKPDKMEPQFLATVSELDRVLLENHPELLQLTMGSWGEAFRSGIAGVHQEAALYPKPWGLRLHDIRASVHLWHGENDNNVPDSVGRHVADAIPHCQATFLKDEGHFTLPYNHMGAILRILVN